ncbi:MAG: hypothetical protein M3M96_05920, partial [Candidatus Eremiobacteraeota bacterium]|nr:hypothetical protein [Candidatus Eremiobacteraeota bacterium]
TSTGLIERMWERFTRESGVRLFRCDDPAVLVAACKPAQDGRGIILRVRECDGEARASRIRCGARMREAIAVDGLERPVSGGVRIEGEELLASLPGYALRSFRVLF